MFFKRFVNLSLTGSSLYGVADIHPYNVKLGLKLIMEDPVTCNVIIKTRFCNALDMVQATITEFPQIIPAIQDSHLSRLSECHKAIDDTVLRIIRRYGDKIVLKLSDRNPKGSKKKGKKQTSSYNKEKRSEVIEEWEGPPPWDMSLGGDGCPKFLCDVMVTCDCCCFSVCSLFHLLISLNLILCLVGE